MTAVLALFIIIFLLLNFSDRTLNRAENLNRDTNAEPAGGEEQADQSKTLNVTVSMDADEFSMLKEATNSYQMKHANTMVKLTNIADEGDGYVQWKKALELGAAPDIMLMDSEWVREFAVRGWLNPVDASSTSDTMSERPARLLDPLKWNSYLWGIPVDANPYVTVWNKALLADAGLSKPPADWNAFSNLLHKLESGGKDWKALYLEPHDVASLLVWLDEWTAEGEEAGAAYLHFDSKAVQEQLKRLESISGRITSSALADYSLSTGTQMEEQHIAAASIPWSIYSKLAAKEQSKLLLDKGAMHDVWLGSRSYVVAGTSKIKEEAFTWIKEMVEIGGRQQSYATTGKLPAKNSLYTGPDNLQESGTAQAGSPPQWWLKVLNGEPAAQPPDPSWHERWMHTQQLWQQYAEGEITMKAFVQAIGTSL
ncbi:ABC-type glycerol-3-phosphate transport system, substrate-binding protein [Paenibacillus algorifonticola]|uniref:ABC-type glycerol-3-phosphate transport system, substrate-binding protein n=1 Tax=Paenibacillus algorifonticola TaxID=684063 RepID=A0A1I1XR97_9BACL|nr:extracellular solute-binding protein [Paenibacillus algorifonticola]SFE09761.1 ABC-type glycerol-3-phosphate transport system, substrate-binding protein [Paenibacillus algorifonticola]